MSTMQVPVLEVVFQRQVWISDFVVPDGGPEVFDAGPIMLALDAEEFLRLDGEIRKGSGRRELSHLAACVAGLLECHDGPSEVSVDRVGYLAWLDAVGLGADRAASAGEADLARVRAVYGLKPHAEERQVGRRISP
jgi:hypothetical protein